MNEIWGEAMITTLTKNKSLTFYQTPSVFPRQNLTASKTGEIGAASISHMSYSTGQITSGYNTQLNNYLSFNQRTQQELLQRTQDFMTRVRQANPNPTATELRDKTTWADVKRLVTRQELMKLKISGKTDLPLSDEQISELRNRIADMDLTSMKDNDVQNLIESISHSDMKQDLAALKDFKYNGKVSKLLQSSKLEALKKDLESIDLEHITGPEMKYLEQNYIERPEYHHRESISSDPNKQSNADNVDVLNTTEHDQKHTHLTETGEEKINYKKPVKEPLRNRNQELKEANSKRVLKNELKGLGLAVAIGAGIGFTIGFISTLAQSGITPDSLKNAAATGLKGGLESGVMSAASYGIGRTLGDVATQAITRVIENIGITVTENIAKMVSMGVVGTLTITLFSAYQFYKLKTQGLSTKEALVQTGKQALFSLSVLAVSIAAQGIWGGSAGIIVSVSIGIITISYSVIDAVHQRHFSNYVRVYTIDRCYPVFASIE